MVEHKPIPRMYEHVAFGRRLDGSVGYMGPQEYAMMEANWRSASRNRVEAEIANNLYELTLGNPKQAHVLCPIHVK